MENVMIFVCLLSQGESNKSTCKIILVALQGLKMFGRALPSSK